MKKFLKIAFALLIIALAGALMFFLALIFFNSLTKILNNTL